MGSQFAGLLYDTATGRPVQSPMELGTNIGVEALAGAAIPQAGGYLMDKAIKPLANAAYQRGIVPAIGKVQEAGLALMDRVGGRSDTVQQVGNALKARFPDIKRLSTVCRVSSSARCSSVAGSLRRSSLLMRSSTRSITVTADCSARRSSSSASSTKSR